MAFGSYSTRALAMVAELAGRQRREPWRDVPRNYTDTNQHYELVLEALQGLLEERIEGRER